MKPRVIAFYLPQYYPTDFNDEWWEPGFTEWTNVAKMKPLFPGHYQPKLPGALGFYDLRVPETRQRQAELAKQAGVESFMYWHYWTAGKKVLNEVFDEVVKTKHPDFGFSLCWANHSWTRCAWNGFNETTMLMEQKYPGRQDHIDHFYDLLPAFQDKRYTRVNGKLLFAIFSPMGMPDTELFMQTWQELAKENGLNGFYFVALNNNQNNTAEIETKGYDAIIQDLMGSYTSTKVVYSNLFFIALRKYLNIAIGNKYSDYCDYFLKHFTLKRGTYPCIYPNWDHSARSGKKATIFRNADPKIWGDFCKKLFRQYKEVPEEEALVFVKSWNEWGEGNYLEPDRRYGMGYIEELRRAIEDVK